MIKYPARVRVGRIVIMLLCCIAVVQTSSAAIELKQPDGDTLSLPGPAKRIITLAPNLAELVFAAGAGEHLSAVVEYSNFPEQVRHIPRVGDAFRIDLERILQLNPDLVIAWKTGNPQTALNKLEQMGINVWQVEISQPREIADIVNSISHAAGTEAVGQAAARQISDRLSRLQERNAGKDPVAFFFQIAYQPLYTINDQHIISRSLAICGGVNIFSDLAALAPPVSRESVIMADPQVMIAPEVPGEPPALLGWQEWPRLQAVKNKAMLYLPVDEISQATPRLLDSIELACKLLDGVRSSIEQVEEK